MASLGAAGSLKLDTTFSYFLDRPAVERRVERKKLRTLKATGFFGRRVMRNSIRKAPKKYRPTPGRPPRYHGKNSHIRRILFGLNGSDGLVIGAMALNSRTVSWTSQGVVYRQSPAAGKTVPELIDQGGEAIRTITYHSGQTTKETIQYDAFPFTEPALEPTQQFLLDRLKNDPL